MTARFFAISFFAALLLWGCASSGSRSVRAGEKAGFIVINNSKRALFLQPMVASRASAAVELAKLKDDKPVPLFEAAHQLAGASSQYLVYVVEADKDIDSKVVGLIRLSPEELDAAQKGTGVKISLEPNAIFVKIGTRYKTYNYIPSPRIGGALPAGEGSPNTEAKK